MLKTEISARISLWLSRFIAAALCLLLFLMPRLVRWYGTIRPLEVWSLQAICIGFYLCAGPVLLALWHIDRLLRSILAREIFIRENVRHIRLICRCCALVSLICLPVSFFYPPLIFLTVIMIFLSMMVNVLKNVMAAAVELREESDLTI